MNGGDLIAEVLVRQQVPFLFTLCGGHISPILVGAKARGIRVVDVRDEKNALFAADAVARLTGRPGVVAVTAGPGMTNTITALKNAQLAQSPVVVLGGATATILKGRGSLQDIDQLALVRPHVKWAISVSRVRDLPAALEQAFRAAQEDVPGPVFVECPVDLLYGEEVVRDWYEKASGSPRSLRGRLLRWYLRRHVRRLFAGAEESGPGALDRPSPSLPPARQVRRAARLLEGAERPVLLVGSQATLGAERILAVAAAVESLGAPVYLSGMARGLLGRSHPLQMRHQRRKALKEADLVLLAGVPCDFRLDYGRHIPGSAVLLSVNRSREDLRRNRRPDLGVLGDPGLFLEHLARAVDTREEGRWWQWTERLRERDEERARRIDAQAAEETEHVNPLALCQAIEEVLPEESVLVADGGDFVATASYIVSPRRPLSWLDPGVFGTLGVGGGFALGAKLCREASEVWILYGDGSAAYSLAEFDTYVRHGLPVIAVVGNDGAWMQIAREQVEVLEDDVGTVLARSDYQAVAEGYGGRGIRVESPEEVEGALRQAREWASAGHPVLVNVLIGRTDFRKGSISM